MLPKFMVDSRVDPARKYGDGRLRVSLSSVEDARLIGKHRRHGGRWSPCFTVIYGQEERRLYFRSSDLEMRSLRRYAVPQLVFCISRRRR